MATNDKYDRQIRLWGGHGQKLLATSKVLLIGANPSGTETLKNLILPAVGHFTIVDGQKVTSRDCGNNFFVTQEQIGQSRAQVTMELLKELNPDVEGNYIEEDIESFVVNQHELIKSYQLVIATDIDNKVKLALSLVCELNDIGLIIVRQYGLVGSIRVYKKELTVIEAKPSDVEVDDLRITNPFPALLQYANSINFDEVDDAVHAHIPYNVILIQTLNQWKDSHEGNLPKNQVEKEQFRELLKSKSRNFSKELNFNEAMTNVFKCFNQYSLRDSVQEALTDPKIISTTEKSSFWLLAAALARFFDQYGVLPLSGKLPDMTSTTEYYVDLQNIYLQKAADDLEIFTNILHGLLLERNVFKESITPDEIRLFCQNCQILEVQRFRSPEIEHTNPDYEDFMNEFFDDESPAPWYVAMRAAEGFRDKNGRLPDKNEDLTVLKEIATDIMKQIFPDDSVKLDEKLLKEMIRYGDSRLHNVGAFLGGVASQEAIKLLIRQYTNLNHTLIYDGIHGRCGIYRV